MTPTKNDIQVRLLFLSDDLDYTATLMREYQPTSQRMLQHADELSGAASLCREWVEGIEGEPGPGIEGDLAT